MPFTILIVNISIAAIFLIIYSAGIFIISRFLRDNSVMDIAYGPAFLFAAAGTLVYTESYALLPAIVTSCIAAWAIRLSSRIFRKNLGKPEDARYAKWRAAWLKKGIVYFWIRSYLQVNLLQVAIILLVALSALIAISYPSAYNPLFLAAGFLVFVFGLTYETIADLQLDRFISGKKAGTETANLMTRGLFKYSRRPNYFGETVVWWGLAIMVLPLPFGWLGLISPLLITYIVTKVTGPMLEDSFLEKYPQEYQAYIDSTNYLIPGRPKVTQP